MNVIIVDWSGGAGFPYEQAVANTRVVGKQIANLLIHLNPAHAKRRFMKLHLIGHSLGAHIASYTANHLKHVYRISGKHFVFNHFTPNKAIETAETQGVTKGNTLSRRKDNKRTGYIR